MLQNNINTLANQLDTLKFINNSQYNNCLSQQNRVKELEEELRKSDYHHRLLSTHQKNKKSLINFLDKNIIKPIKGGSYFKKNIFLKKTLKSKVEETLLISKKRTS